MYSLPVANRELLVAARRPVTIWSRWVAVLIAGFIAAVFLAVSRFDLLPQSGATLFSTLTRLCFAGLLLAGVFLTSDCISEEKREGTLGFLFLTQLTGLDVIAGKLSSTSIRAFYNLLAIVPVLAIPFLMGGVSGGQFVRTVVSLVCTMFFSLAAGLFISTCSRDARRAMMATFLVLAAFAFGAWALDFGVSLVLGGGYTPTVGLVSPALLFNEAGQVTPRFFYPALGSVMLVALLLFAFACGLVRRTWQDRKTKSVIRSAHRQRNENAIPKTRAKRDLLDVNPVLWLVCRERWQSALIWVLLIITFFVFCFLALWGGNQPLAVIWPPVVGLISLTLYVWAAAQAPRFIIDARRSRAIELLLASPLDVPSIIEGQWRGLLRQVRWPLLFLVLLLAAGNVGFSTQTAIMAGSAPGLSNATALLASLATGVAALLVTCANLAAIGWFGIWMGITSQSANFAALKTLLFVMVIPWFVLSLFSGILMALLLAPFLTAGTPVPSLTVWLSLVPASLSILKAAFFILYARRRLYSSFHERLLRDFLPVTCSPPRLVATPSSPPAQ